VWLKDSGRAVPRPQNATLALGNCGGLACVFSRGLLRALPSTELEQCSQCMPGMADQQLSFCVFFNSGVGPVGLPAFSWGQASHSFLDAVLTDFPACASACAASRGGGGAGACELRCAEQLGALEWYSIHMRNQQNTWRGWPMEKIVEAQHTVSLQLRSLPHARAAAVGKACCHLVGGELGQCHNGCIPWRSIADGSTALRDRDASRSERERYGPLQPTHHRGSRRILGCRMVNGSFATRWRVEKAPSQRLP